MSKAPAYLTNQTAYEKGYQRGLAGGAIDLHEYDMFITIIERESYLDGFDAGRNEHDEYFRFDQEEDNG